MAAVVLFPPQPSALSPPSAEDDGASFYDDCSQGGSQQVVPRSSHLEEYSKHRPLSAGMRPRTLLNKIAQAAGLAAEDSDVDADADPWILEGWGEEPSVPEKARQASTKMLSKWARNLPCALPNANMPAQRRILSAGPHRGAPAARRQQPAAGGRRPQGDGGDSSSSPAKQGGNLRRATQPTMRRLGRPQHADLEVGDESDIEPGDRYSPSPPPAATAAAAAAAAAAKQQPAAAAIVKPVGQQTQQLMQLLNGQKKALDALPSPPAAAAAVAMPTTPTAPAGSGGSEDGGGPVAEQGPRRAGAQRAAAEPPGPLPGRRAPRRAPRSIRSPAARRARGAAAPARRARPR